MGTPKVSLRWDVNSAHLLMDIVREVHPWVSAPIHAANNLCIFILTSRILDRRPYAFPIQRVHVWDSPLVSPDGS